MRLILSLVVDPATSAVNLFVHPGIALKDDRDHRRWLLSDGTFEVYVSSDLTIGELMDLIDWRDRHEGVIIPDTTQ